MNTPNKLTVLRMLMVPVFMFFALIDGTVWQIMALAIFALASFTDYLDGKIARANGLVTTFGKFMDPLADKLLTTAAFLVFMDKGLISSWVIIIVLFREFAVSGIRLVAAGTGEVIAASFWGKLKTVSQMIAIILTFVLIIIPLFSYNVNYIIINVSIWISTVLTLLSGWDYIYKNKNLLKFK
ncbi:MAG: CDP-diacylglycerol--glycerol-3-phosphate 3-phosphatidyltransferase [Clostridia bacterium]|nr:CDP-diacylglycerol--glycerol-3-phosphate 3-phosphatidyltransferase [Clostridia bacterium]